ncbi:MAG: DEAD/DEAH box helicase [bacterium]|nr:DEAD/DEAH box helicase [bacterium]
MFTGGLPQDNVVTADKSFSDLGLSLRLTDALREIAFYNPTPIQAEVLPRALEGADLIGLAQTGSGKTAAFCLPMVERLAPNRGTRALVLCPTREIAMQTKSFLDVLEPTTGFTSVCLIGGVRMDPQISKLRTKPDVIVATPGRLLDHVGRRTAYIDRVEYLVLDEADHMLDLGFLPQILRVLELLPAQRQTMMFSATMPAQIDRIARRFMREPEQVDFRPDGRTAEGIEHRLYLVQPENMRACLMGLLEQEQGSTLVFLRRKVDAEWAYKQLKQEGHRVDRMHSDRSQGQRVEALASLRSGKNRILLATNVAARGIDIPVIEHIINYGIPENVEEYVHRAGRTARGDAEGIASTIATWKHKEEIAMIERALGRPLPRCAAPGVEPYVERKTTIRGRKIRRRRLL